MNGENLSPFSARLLPISTQPALDLTPIAPPVDDNTADRDNGTVYELPAEYWRWIGRGLGADLPFDPSLPPSFPPKDREAVQRRLAELRQMYAAEILLSQVTGAATLLTGRFSLLPGPDVAPERTAQLFLARYGLALTGSDAPLELQPQWKTTWDDTVWTAVQQLRYRQFVTPGAGDEPVPVWGAFVAFTFDSDRRLSVVSSTLLPVDNPQSLRFPEPAPALPTLQEAIRSGLPEVIELLQGEIELWYGSGEAWPLILKTRVPDDSPVERIAFPSLLSGGRRPRWLYGTGGWARLPDTQDEEAEPAPRGLLLPAYRVYFVDQFDIPWLCILDARLWGVQPLILFAAPAAAWSTNLRQCVVMPTTGVAEQFGSALTALRLAPGDPQPLQALQDLIATWLGAVDFGVRADGSPIESLAESPFVQFSGARFVEPLLPPAAQPAPEAYLASNIIYHLAALSTRWGEWLGSAAFAGWHVDGDQDNPLQRIAVHLDSILGTPYCNLLTGGLHLTRGNGGLIREPSFDCEVIAHEYAHAVLHYFASPLFQPAQWNDIACQAFDEGMAFYWACTVFGNAQWAEYGYTGKWQLLRNLATAPVRFGDIDFTGANEGWAHTVGIWWAGVLWRLRGAIGATALRYVLLKLLNGLPGLAPAQVSAGTPTERIRAVFVTIGGNLLAQTPQLHQPVVLQVLQNAEAA